MLAAASFATICSTGPVAADPNFGMPPEVAQKAYSHCAKAPNSLYMQVLCMEQESDAYYKLGAPHKPTVAELKAAEERRTGARFETNYRDPPGSTIEPCPPATRMTEMDGCQIARYLIRGRTSNGG
jgi:hypothetical protein